MLRNVTTKNYGKKLDIINPQESQLQKLSKR